MNHTKLRDYVIELSHKGSSPKFIKSVISKNTGFKKTKTQELYNDWVGKVLKTEVDLSPALEFSDKYVFNKEDQKYIFFCKGVGKNIVLPKSEVDYLIKSYSSFYGDESSLNELSLKFNLPKLVVSEILAILGVTHSSLPVSNEDIASKSEEELVSQILQDKKFYLFQKLQKQDWSDTQIAAKKWYNFESSTLNPFETLLEKWQPAPYKPVGYKFPAVTDDKYWIVSMSDVHWGLIAEERYLYFKKEWNIEETSKAVGAYAKKVAEHVKDRKSSYKGAYLCLMGDLIHTLSGYTDKGTELEAFPIREQQLDIAFNTLVLFVQEMLSLFPEICVKAVAGNHSSLGDYVLARMLECHFRLEKRIKFEITTKRYLTFRIFDNLFLMEHGYSAFFKSRLPRGGAPRENYINGLFLAKPELLTGVKNKYFLSADLHHLEVKETNFYEHIMFSTLAGGCRHSDNSGFNNRARQSCLVVNKDGVSEIIHVFFD